jgi:hypothetical protein
MRLVGERASGAITITIDTAGTGTGTVRQTVRATPNRSSRYVNAKRLNRSGNRFAYHRVWDLGTLQHRVGVVAKFTGLKLKAQFFF